MLGILQSIGDFFATIGSIFISFFRVIGSLFSLLFEMPAKAVTALPVLPGIILTLAMFFIIFSVVRIVVELL